MQFIAMKNRYYQYSFFLIRINLIFESQSLCVFVLFRTTLSTTTAQAAINIAHSAGFESSPVPTAPPEAEADDPEAPPPPPPAAPAAPAAAFGEGDAAALGEAVVAGDFAGLGVIVTPVGFGPGVAVGVGVADGSAVIIQTSEAWSV